MLGPGCRRDAADAPPAPPSEPTSPAPAATVDGAQYADDDLRCKEEVCWHEIDGLPRSVAVFREQVWSTEVYSAVLARYRQHDFRGKRVLDMGCGHGIQALFALEMGASTVVATDINPTAIRNTEHNAELFGFADRIDARLVSLDDPGAYAVIGDDERFDFVLMNPPWEDRTPAAVEDRVLYDDGYAFMGSALDGLLAHLEPGGRMLCGHAYPPGMRYVRDMLRERGLKATIHHKDGDEDFLEHEIRAREEDYGGLVMLEIWGG